MSTYKDFIASEDYSPALKARNIAIGDVERFIRRVKKLSEEDPNPTVFTKLRLETEKAISHLDKMMSKCQELIIENCEDYNDDTAYHSDLEAYDDAVLKWEKLLGAESDRVQGSIPVKEVKIQHNDMTQVILNQLKTRNDLI